MDFGEIIRGGGHGLSYYGIIVWVQDFRDKGVFVIWNSFCYGLQFYKPLRNLSTELIKTSVFFWCQMWDVTLKWTTVSRGFGEAKGGEG